jgi:hypothetical protein
MRSRSAPPFAPLSAGVRHRMSVGSWMRMACLASIVAGCSSNRSFSESNMFASVSLDLRRDGSFAFASTSDEIGNECLAEGDWKKHRSDGVEYVALEIRKYTKGGPENCESLGLKQHGLWFVSHSGIVSVSGPHIKSALT